MKLKKNFYYYDNNLKTKLIEKKYKIIEKLILKNNFLKLYRFFKNL